MIKKIDHIAIAVENLERAIETFKSVLGCASETIIIEEVASENVRVALIPLGESRIELLQPLGDDNAIARFLAKNGEGMHHIALETDDISHETERLESSGLKPLGSQKEGAGGKQIIFLHPKQTNRVLLEITQEPH
ncbi:methylmalonyl-CoA epimerase [Chlorobium phaeobacteroides]|uniref:Methylmalonyl-CoA epimerase n=1 Tax=Chlorobium phaeobacteroides (strain DSM 266 / SMG 266 / 2430) TaxID=290317 RepID=A1BFM7_CHLPD|nr:methylmalonyl-CoA epimerase [Chlorobium phaeobacteroides]ABL65204.1 methylmalonyl-CoA epimerase [Chlorobium phaeobacteroides DSM 266]